MWITSAPHLTHLRLPCYIRIIPATPETSGSSCSARLTGASSCCGGESPFYLRGQQCRPAALRAACWIGGAPCPRWTPSSPASPRPCLKARSAGSAGCAPRAARRGSRRCPEVTPWATRWRWWLSCRSGQYRTSAAPGGKGDARPEHP